MDARSTCRALAVMTTGLFPAMSLTGLGCHTEPEEAADSSAMASKPGEVAGKLIYSKTLGPRHLVEFFEFEGGTVGVREAIDTDAGELVFGERAPVSTLSEAFRTLDPGATVVPATVLEADRRASEKQLAMATRATPPEPVVAPETGPAGGSDVETTSQALVFCSVDLENDDWGGPKFTQEHCKGGRRRLCVENMETTILPEQRYSRGFRWIHREGDWYVAGSLRMSWIACNLLGCEPRTDIINQKMPPRQTLSWTFTDGNDRFGVTRAHSPCGHMHYAQIVF